MNLTHVAVVFRKELRETLRDRRTLTVMFLFPLVVYPLISLLMAEVMAGKQATDDARTSHVALVAADPGTRAALLAQLTKKGSGLDVAHDLTHAGPAAVNAGLVDAVVEALPAKPGTPSLGVRVIYDETHPASDQAHDRVNHALGGVLPNGCFQTYAVSGDSLATKMKIGGYVLSKILPLIVVIMTMLGAFYPAIDITAGERERGTLETLLSSPVQRFDLMTGKVLAVASLSLLTGFLNIVSMSLTVAEGARLAAGSPILAIPWSRAVATLVIVVPAAFLFGSVMVAIGAMARSFKEAQTLLMPVYLLCFTPSLVASMADFRLSGIALLVPGTNLTLLARDLMLGEASLLSAIVVLTTTIGFGALALAFAARLYDSERLLASTDSELVGLSAWLRYLVGRKTVLRPPLPPTAGQAVSLFGTAFVLWFFVFTWLQRWDLIPGLLISQWVGFLGLVWLYARLVRRPLGDVLVFTRPRGAALAGAACIGLSGWIILGILADRLMPPPREVVDSIRHLIHPPGESRSLALSLFALAVTPAVCEESLFRGAILQGLRRQFSVPVSCVLTGILFGVMHGDVWRFVPTSLLGMLLSWVALSSGSIIPSMLVHVLNNGVLIVLGYYGLDEAGEKMSLRGDLMVLAAALLLLLGGVAAIRKGARQSAALPQ
ncbi:MAG TPA: ABC transporter permease subunit/CPBP intramembrane protease [Polyangia bacterium]